jgi:hypothetical protein
VPFSTKEEVCERPVNPVALYSGLAKVLLVQIGTFDLIVGAYGPAGLFLQAKSANR